MYRKALQRYLQGFLFCNGDGESAERVRDGEMESGACEMDNRPRSVFEPHMAAPDSIAQPAQHGTVRVVTPRDQCSISLQRKDKQG